MVNFIDRVPIGSIKKTEAGYLVATSRVARAGIQEYRASELGLVGDHVMKVMRHEDDVFAKDAMATLSRVPVTVGHPGVPVDATNWKDYAVGEVGDTVMRDGDWIVVNPMIKDAAALLAAQTTHQEISMGYAADLEDADPESGADFKMVNLRFDHLALVPKGRAGSQARIGDADWGASPVTVEDKQMTVELKTVILGDKSVSVEAKDADTVAAVLKDHKAVLDAKDGEIGELKAKLADAEAKVMDDAAVAALVDAKVASQAKRDAVKAKFGDEAVKDASDAMIEGMFKVIGQGVNDKARAVIGDKKIADDDGEVRIKAAQAKFLNIGVK